MRASAGIRILAATVDSICLLALIVATALGLSLITGVSFETMSAHVSELKTNRDVATLVRVLHSEGFRLQKLIDIAGLLLPVLWYLSEVIGSASPGKMLFGLKIGSISGEKSTLSDRATRYLVLTGPAILMLIANCAILLFASSSNVRPLFSLLMIIAVGGFLAGLYGLVILIGAFGAFTSNRLCLHDKVSGTAVYRGSEWNPEEASIPPACGGTVIPTPVTESTPSKAVDQLIFK